MLPRSRELYYRTRGYLPVVSPEERLFLSFLPREERTGGKKRSVKANVSIELVGASILKTRTLTNYWYFFIRFSKIYQKVIKFLSSTCEYTCSLVLLGANSPNSAAFRAANAFHSTRSLIRDDSSRDESEKKISVTG